MKQRFLPLTYFRLLVKVRGQLNQPGRLHRRHVTHEVFGRLQDFIEDHPGQETAL